MFFFFFFNDTATTEIYTLSLHDALPISPTSSSAAASIAAAPSRSRASTSRPISSRSEEHTSELQSRQYLVCRLLLEKKKKRKLIHTPSPHLLQTSACSNPTTRYPTSTFA